MASTGVAAGLTALATMFGGSKMVNAQVLGLNAMGPTPEQAQAFMQLPDQPVVMVNLLKFRDGGAGAADYGEYGRNVEKILSDIGAEIIFSGECTTTFIGGAEWDRIAMSAIQTREPCYKWPNRLNIKPLAVIAHRAWKDRLILRYLNLDSGVCTELI